MISCPNKNLQAWKDLEEACPENKYTIWDMNNGYGLDRTPDGKDSILFSELLDHFKDAENPKLEAMRAKAYTFSNEFRTKFASLSIAQQDANGEVLTSVLLNENPRYNPQDYNPLSFSESKHIQQTMDVVERIQQGLESRLKSLMRYDIKMQSKWAELQKVIRDIANSDTEAGILEFLQHVADVLPEASRFINAPNQSFTLKQLYRLSRDFLGFYYPLLQQIHDLLVNTDLLKNRPNYIQIKSDVDNQLEEMRKMNETFSAQAKDKSVDLLESYLRQYGMPEDMIRDTVNYLTDPKTDTSMLFSWIGMASNSNNPVLGTIAKILNDTRNQTDREVLSKGIELVKLVNAAKARYGNGVQKLLYERDKDGKFTGYRVTKRNIGEYKKAKAQWQEKVAKKLGIKKDENGHYVPADSVQQARWDEKMEEFYTAHTERRFDPEYYKLRNELLSQETKDAQDELQNLIDELETRVTHDGVVYENELSDEDRRRLNELRRQKQLLANSFNMDGTEKSAGSIEWKIAKELQLFKQTISQHIKYTSDRDKYDADYKKAIARYGAGSQQLAEWVKANTRVQYSDEFYERLKRCKEANSAQQTQTYLDLVDKRKQLLNLYRDPQTGKVDLDLLSDMQREQLRQLDQDIANAYTRGSANGEKFSDFAEIVETEEYKNDYAAAQAAGTQVFADWYQRNHYYVTINGQDYAKPASYYTVLRPKQQFLAQYTETVPAIKYSMVDPAKSDWYNYNFDESADMAIQPKASLYDNSQAYNEMASKPEVKALYDAVEQTMQEAYGFISFLSNPNLNMMPQISHKTTVAMCRKDGVMAKLGYLFEDIGITKEDDLDFYTKSAGVMPNGSPINVIPTRFIDMLADPNTISTDAVSAVVQFYNMAVNYKNMAAQQINVETLLDLLKGLEIKDSETNTVVKQKGESNVYKQAKLLVDRIMYGKNMRTSLNTDNGKIHIPMTFNMKGREVNVAKLLNSVRSFITKVNLHSNIWSIATSFLTDTVYTNIEAALGRYFDSNDLAFANKEYLAQLPAIMEDIGNPMPKGKLPYLMMLNQVIKDNKELFDRMYQSKTSRVLNQHYWYAGYTQADYCVKSHTLLSIYHSYKFVNGVGFMNKKQYIDKYYKNDRKRGEVEFKNLSVTLYSAYDVDKDGNVTIDSKYEQYITTKLLNDVKNRINIITKRVDGTLRDVDKAAIHANAILAFTTMHKNFIIQLYHDRFKKKHYNLDMGAIEQGYYRSFASFIKNCTKNHSLTFRQIMQEFDQLEDYEQYGVKRVMLDAAVIMCTTTIALLLCGLVDGDDDYDNWLMQAFCYIALRTAFEFRTAYNPIELLNLFRSPSAGFSWFENMSAFINLVNPTSYIGDKSAFSTIDRGVYKGMPRIMRNVVKVTPFRSAFELRDPKVKRNYLQNQLMNF